MKLHSSTRARIAEEQQLAIESRHRRYQAAQTVTDERSQSSVSLRRSEGVETAVPVGYNLRRKAQPDGTT